MKVTPKMLRDELARQKRTIKRLNTITNKLKAESLEVSTHYKMMSSIIRQMESMIRGLELEREDASK